MVPFRTLRASGRPWPLSSPVAISRNPESLLVEPETVSSLYSIVIPTRERADVLRYAMKTVLKQTRSNYELIIMDNCGSPATRAVVDELDDPHVRYFRSSERLSMSDNWERALEHVRGNYVTFMGDDDGLMPDAIETAERFHRDWPERIVSWFPFIWMWPEALVEDEQSRARTFLGSHAEVRVSREWLKDVYTSREYFSRLPTIYCSFVPRKILEIARSEQGRIFNSPIPDVYSGLVNLAYSDEFIYLYRPLGIWGVSRHSTGSAQVYNVGESHKLFNEENRTTWGQAFDEKLVERDFIVEVLVADVLLNAKRTLFADDDEIELDMASFLQTLCDPDVARRFHAQKARYAAAIDDMARKNGIDPTGLTPQFPDNPNIPTFEYRIDVARDFAQFRWFTDPTSVRTIEDFVDHAARFCVAPDQIALIDPRQPQPTPTRGARKAMYDLHRICDDRLAMIESLTATCAERQTMADDLRRTCDERMSVIGDLQRTCDERLALIGELQRACDERLALIRDLEQTCEQRLEIINRLAQRLTEAAQAQVSTSGADPRPASA